MQFSLDALLHGKWTQESPIFSCIILSLQKEETSVRQLRLHFGPSFHLKCSVDQNKDSEILKHIYTSLLRHFYLFIFQEF